jgi:hypothetical protein
VNPRELPPAELLARRLCKLLHQSGTLSRLDLGQAVERRQRSTLSPRARRRLEQQDGEFARALELAIAKGWIQFGPDACTLTSLGSDQARRSRTGIRKRRRFV